MGSLGAGLMLMQLIIAQNHCNKVVNFSSITEYKMCISKTYNCLLTQKEPNLECLK